MKYRCSSCDKLKSPQNVRYVAWANSKREAVTVAVCQKCRNDMAKNKFQNVSDFLGAK